MFSFKIKNLYKFSMTIRPFSLGRFPPIEILLIKNEDNSFNSKKNSVQKYQTVELAFSRTFLQFSGSKQGMKKEYAGRKLVGYSMEQMFDVVADVENYNSFIPFCKKSLVTSRTSNNLKADLIIGFPPIIESYTSNVTLVKPNLVKAVCTDGKLFHHLLTVWKFSPGLTNVPQTCVIDFFVSFEFRSSLHSQLANMFFNELVRQMEGAFYDEAKSRYGKPILKMQQLHIQNKDS